MSRAARLAVSISLVLTVIALPGCGSDHRGAPGTEHASCAASIVWHHQRYFGMAAGAPGRNSYERYAGVAVLPACDDTPGGGPPQHSGRTRVWKLRAIPTTTALASRSARTAMLWCADLNAASCRTAAAALRRQRG
jgi:hypothetical protein